MSLYGFTEGGARRIVGATRKVESEGAGGPGALGLPPAAEHQGFWAKLTSSVLSGSVYNYAWTQVYYKGGWTTLPSAQGGMSGTTTSGYAINGAVPSGCTDFLQPTNAIVRVEPVFDASDSTGQTVLWMFFASVAGESRVAVSQTGGSAGSKTTQCTFTYTVKDRNGNTLATGVSPKMQRPSIGKIVAGSIGFISNVSGAIELTWCDEVPSKTSC